MSITEWFHLQWWVSAFIAAIRLIFAVCWTKMDFLVHIFLIKVLKSFLYNISSLGQSIRKNTNVKHYATILANCAHNFRKRKILQTQTNAPPTQSRQKNSRSGTVPLAQIVPLKREPEKSRRASKSPDSSSRKCSVDNRNEPFRKKNNERHCRPIGNIHLRPRLNNSKIFCGR